MITIINTVTFCSINKLNIDNNLNLPFNTFTNNIILTDILTSPIRYLLEIKRS